MEKEINKVMDLLNMGNLSSEEQMYLNDLSNKNPEVKKIIKTFNILKESKERKFAVTTDILAEYILYKNGDENADEEVIKNVPEIEKQLRESEELSEEYLLLSEEYSNAENFVVEKATNVDPNIVVPMFKKFKYTAVSILSLVIIYVALFVGINTTTPSYKKDMSFSKISETGITRGRVSESFQKSLLHIKNGDYSEAVKELNNDIKINENDRTIFYSHYILGKVYLKMSKSNILGLYNSYNDESLLKAVEQLNLAVSSNNTGSFKNITHNSYFYIANAYIVLDSLGKAQNFLQIVTDNKGEYMLKAEELLKSIQYGK